jgi:uncharacterized protein YozE (UPF0346 family)
MSTASCQTCIGNSGNDLTGVSQLKKIERMISDNYTMIFISFLLIIILLLVIWHFYSDLRDTLKNYYKIMQNKTSQKGKAILAGSSASFPEDEEDYDDEPSYLDSTAYFESGKADFAKKMDSTYKEYNKEKTDYIRSTHRIDNDDVVDTSSVLYKKYDDYSYSKE